MSNIFTKAAAAAPKAPAKSKKPDKVSVPIKGMKRYAAICQVFTSVETIKKTLASDIKTRILAHFVVEGMKTKGRPVNFQGSEDGATGSCELRVRGSNIPLSETEQALLTEHDIPFETTDRVTETYIINPAYAQDEAMLALVSKALEKVKGLPEDFIQLQSEKSAIVTAESVTSVFALEDVALVTELLPIVTVIAAGKTKVGGDDKSLAYDVVRGMIDEQDKADAAAKAEEA